MKSLRVCYTDGIANKWDILTSVKEKSQNLRGDPLKSENTILLSYYSKWKESWQIYQDS